ANAITREGGNDFHAAVYYYAKNEALNANGFQENRLGLPRAPGKEVQPGLVASGPIQRDRLFFSSAYEYFRSRGAQDPQQFNVPATRGIFNFAFPGTQSRRLLQQFAPPAVMGNGITGDIKMARPVEVDRTLAVERLDYTPRGGRDRVIARLMGSFLEQP